jgi:ketosteroid isomerase-like protein
MEPADAQEFAAEWARAWNARDLESLVAHYADDVVFTSPVADRLVPGSGGVVQGKPALRAYFAEGLRRIPDLHFEVVEVYSGVDVLVINFRDQRGHLVNEVLTFREGRVVRGQGTYRVEEA